jgi:hypothetical protein
MPPPTQHQRDLARRVRRSEEPITELAEIYGITIETEQPWFRLKDTSRGPQGGGCSPLRRVIYVEEHMVLRENFHELCHVICAVPWAGCASLGSLDPLGFDGISGICEGHMLMQFERSLARAVFTEDQLEDVVEWQSQTQVLLKRGGRLRYLEKIRRYTRQGFWREGFGRLKRVGLLDENNFPTFAWADWSKLTRQDRAAL